MEKFWPYVLPLPIEPTKHEAVLHAVFGSKVALEILKRASPGRKMYQKDLIKESKFSNKTVIENLKKLVSIGVLAQGMERVKVHGRATWTKWYTLTFLGKWIACLLLSPKSIPREDAEAIIKELFRIYADNVVKLCFDYGISCEAFKSAVEDAYLKKRLEEKEAAPSKCSRVVVWGSAALDMIAYVDKVPKPDEAIYVEDVAEFPGGSGANVAVALSRLGVSASFVGKLGGDPAGMLLFDELKNEGVDVSGVVIDPELVTTKSFIAVSQKGEKRTYILGGGNAALSITSPDEVDWTKIKKCDLVYIGEVFTEIAELIASFARNYDKKVIYRPSMPYLEFGLERLRNILKNVDIFMMNESGWNTLKVASKGLENPDNLLTLGPEIVIITRGYEGCEIFARKEVFEAPAVDVKAVDVTGAGDAFIAGFIKALLESKDVRNCVKYATVAATISITKMGARKSLPTASEVKEFAASLHG